MKTIIAGGRDRYLTKNDYILLNLLKPLITEEFCGEASGIDTDGKLWAQSHKIPVRSFPADWKKHGRSAGPIRNEQMAKDADVLIAFDGGRGTQNMINLANRHGVIVFDFRVNPLTELNSSELS